MYNNISLAGKVRLLDLQVLPTLFWGLETLPLTIPQSLDAMQRMCRSTFLFVQRKTIDMDEEFCRRWEGRITHAIAQQATSRWSDLQQFIFTTVARHLQRLHEEHWVAAVFKCRDSEWNKTYYAAQPTTSAMQSGRRPAGRGPPNRYERTLLQAWAQYKESPAGAGVNAATWKEAAEDGSQFIHVARWVAFVADEAVAEGGPRNASDGI